MKMPEWSEEKLREIAKAEEEAGFIGCGDTPYNRAVHAVVQSKGNETEDFEEHADRIVMGEAINGDRSWMQFAKDQTAKVLALESRNAALQKEVDRLNLAIEYMRKSFDRLFE